MFLPKKLMLKKSASFSIYFNQCQVIYGQNMKICIVTIQKIKNIFTHFLQNNQQFCRYVICPYLWPTVNIANEYSNPEGIQYKSCANIEVYMSHYFLFCIQTHFWKHMNMFKIDAVRIIQPKIKLA